MLALFLYLENKIIRSIGNPKMADNRKMVATCQGSTCRKILTSGVEENAYSNWAFSPEQKELTHCRDFTGWSGCSPPQETFHSDKRTPRLSIVLMGKPQTADGGVGTFPQAAAARQR